jgi:pimeloyl-ACP methyl ester carboxylesterase
MVKILASLGVLLLVASCSAISEDTRSTPALSFLSTPKSSQKLIVFVHGVFGDPSATWTNRAGKTWMDLMKDDDAFREYTLATYRYDSPFRGRTSTIQEIATRMLGDLNDADVFRNYNEIYFIAHSMGGLVTKRVLVDLNSPGHIDKLRRVKAVLYISTPAQGADIANFGSWFSPNPQLRDTETADLNSYLQNLEDQWADLMRQRGAELFPQSFCAYETKPTYGKMIVSRTDATTICDQNPVAFDEDHISIVKPLNRQSDIYVWAQTRIQQASTLATPRFQYVLFKTPFSNYKPGLIIEGIEWKENYREYEFSVRHLGKNGTIVDLRLHFELPWPLISSQIYSQEGCEGLVLMTPNKDIKVGTDQEVVKVVRARTNVLEIIARTMFPEAVFRGRIILSTGEFRSSHPNLQVSYRDQSVARRNSFFYKISMLDAERGTVRIEPEPATGIQDTGPLILFEEPIEFPAR